MVSLPPRYMTNIITALSLFLFFISFSPLLYSPSSISLCTPIKNDNCTTFDYASSETRRSMVDHRVIASLSDILISLSLFSDIFGCISPLAAHIPECVSTIFGCLNPRFLLLSFSRLEFIVPYPFGRAGGAILLFDKCTYLRLSMSICRLSPSLSLFLCFFPSFALSLYSISPAPSKISCAHSFLLFTCHSSHMS